MHCSIGIKIETHQDQDLVCEQAFWSSKDGMIASSCLMILSLVIISCTSLDSSYCIEQSLRQHCKIYCFYDFNVPNEVCHMMAVVVLLISHFHLDSVPIHVHTQISVSFLPLQPFQFTVCHSYADPLQCFRATNPLLASHISKI
jgi:hypothetical protein